MFNYLRHPVFVKHHVGRCRFGVVCFLILLSISVFGQKYKSVYEFGQGKTKYVTEADLIVTEKAISIKYKGDFFYKDCPIIKKVSKFYILARDNQAHTTDLWIFQSKYKIVRVWSNQRTNSFGRITYTLIR